MEMERKAVFGVMLALLLTSILTVFNVQAVEIAGPIYIRPDGSVIPSTAPISTVDNVTYTLTDNITITGLGNGIYIERNNVILDGAGYTVQGLGNATGITLQGRSNVTVKNTTINNFDYGIGMLSYSSNNSIVGNNLVNNAVGIWLYSSSNNSISGNSMKNNSIFLSLSSNNIISGNTIEANQNSHGIWLYSSPNNSIVGNNIKNNWKGIGLDISSGSNHISGNNITANQWDGIFLSSSNNSIVGNNIANNDRGISLSSSSNNSVCHNNFLNNTVQVYSYNSTNIWDDGYPSGGNYWDDYNELDSDGDGIGDAPYVINVDNQDRYPLVVPRGPIPIIWDDIIYPIELNSNSTISRFRFNVTQKRISFNVTGSDGTIGFCNLTLPNNLVQNLWQGDFTVLVDGEEPIAMNNWTDGTYTHIYLTYQHSEHEVIIVPEFPTFLIMSLFIITTSLAIVIRKRKKAIIA